MYLKKNLLVLLLLAIASCSSSNTNIINQHSIGIINYGNDNKNIKKYQKLEEYLGTELNSAIEIEPVYNEIRALQQISSKKWDLVFAPPGLAAIAISRYGYEPVMPLEGRDRTRSAIVVRNDSPDTERRDLAGKTITLGQKGSATGYYLPLYNLYGLNFKEILYAPTPKNILQQISEGKTAAGALSLEEYNLYRRDFPPNTFRVLYLDKHNIPPGAILVSDRIERNQEAQIISKLIETPSFISSSVGFLTKQELPDYDYLVKVIERVQQISQPSTASPSKPLNNE